GRSQGRPRRQAVLLRIGARICRSALARDGGLTIADAGKPCCYGGLTQPCRSELARDDALEIAPAGKPDCYEGLTPI
ncbi:hypothetical protein NPS29_20630, partial [Pseudomonas putida]|uniref:hypothetical protein n=1 Tax=Pseudomonas putida TaxID=303 RepID=UPI002363877A